MFKIYDGRTEFYQWDLDQKLIVSDPTITEVHFCNQTEACSLVCEVYEEDGQHLVNVPNILLQDNWPIRAYAHCDCFTKASTTFEIIARTKPADYVYTETEVKTWEELNEKIEKLNISGSAIIDVDALPTEDINTNVFYRTPSTESCIIINGVKNPSFDGVTPKVVQVDDLPSVGEDFITTATIYLYTVDDKCYLYSAEHNAWIDANKEGFPCVVIDSEADAIESDVWYILKSGKSKIHYYTDKWNEIGESDGESGGGIILDYDTATSPEILHACKVMTELGASVYVRRGDMLYVANEGILQNEVGLISCLALSTDSDVQPPILKLRKIGLGSIRGEVIKAIDDNSLNDIFVTNETFSALDSKVDTVESIAKGANQAVSFSNYSTMITALNTLPSDTYNVGQNIMIVTVEVPDLWVSEISESSIPYTYTDDATFVTALKENGSVQVGYYVLSQLETQKVDLTNYLEKGVPPSAGRQGVYGIEKDGTQTVFMADAGQAADKVALTDAYGCLKVADPRAGNDAASKQYVDNNFTKNTDEAGDGVLGLAQYAWTNGDDIKAGIVSYNGVFGINAINNTSWPNTLCINAATNPIIDKQEDIYRPITVARLSHAVKVGVTANKEHLTDEEKAAACEWLGAPSKADITEGITVANEAKAIATEAKNTADSISGLANNALGIANSALAIAQETKDECEGYHAEVKALLECDDETLNEIQEIVDYTKSNKELIDEITIKKVNVADIVDNLTSTATDKPLSANMGRELNEFYSEAISDLSADLTTERTRAKAAEKANADAIAEIVDWANNTDQDITDVTSQALRGYTVSSADVTLEKTADSPKVRVKGTPEEYLIFEDAYRVSNYGVAKENLLGATISARYIFDNMGGSVNADNYSESFEHTITLDDMLTIAEGNGGYRITINKALSNGSHTFSGYIYVVNDYEAYTSDSGIAFDSNGIYLSLINSESASGYYIQEISKLTFTNTERVKSSGEYVELTSNIEVMILKAKIEALEAKIAGLTT